MRTELLLAMVGLLESLSVAVVAGVFSRAAKLRKAADAEKERREEARAKENEERAEVRRKESAISMSLIAASINLGKATAIAVKEGHANGQMSQAFNDADESLKKYFDFINDTAAGQLAK